ncbi:hypothetical protein BDM02DRAFT_3188678 [Thelephora ganbajun]|uniref:Uncharacterized protein n=1 Tax=Thelephora ganbajun TaxID=370292 RepID=A0ACB6ZAW4_THEGA|nr:hypothetical protein BDM02DRAFT_3188678 [Thelephora ganbajun]
MSRLLIPKARKDCDTFEDKLKQTEFKPLSEGLWKIDLLSLFILSTACTVILRATFFNAPTAVSSKRVDGKFLGPSCTVSVSQAVCSSLAFFDITQEIKAQDESKYVAGSLESIFDWLTEIGRELAGLALPEIDEGERRARGSGEERSAMSQWFTGFVGGSVHITEVLRHSLPATLVE